MAANLTQIEQAVLDEFTAYAETNGALQFHNEDDIYVGRNAQKNAKRRTLARLAKKGCLRESKLGGGIYALPASDEIEALRQAMDEAIDAIRRHGILKHPGLLDEAELVLRKQVYAWNKPTGRTLPEMETF